MSDAVSEPAKRWYQSSLIPGGMDGPYAYTCPDCGALVVDTGTHDRWHDGPATPATPDPEGAQQ